MLVWTGDWALASHRVGSTPTSKLLKLILTAELVFWEPEVYAHSKLLIPSRWSCCSSVQQAYRAPQSKVISFQYAFCLFALSSQPCTPSCWHDEHCSVLRRQLYSSFRSNDCDCCYTACDGCIKCSFCIRHCQMSSVLHIWSVQVLHRPWDLKLDSS